MSIRGAGVLQTFILYFRNLLASCSGKGPDIKNPRHKCPDQSESTLKDIFCKE